MLKGFSSVVVIILAIAIISILAGAAFFTSKPIVSKTSVPTISQLQPTTQFIQVTTAPTAPEVKSYPGTQEFISQNLKIAFNYLPETQGMKISTKEAGNRVYVGPSNTNIEQGQYVEVFQKNPADSLAVAIRRRFLAGKSEAECWVVDTTANFKNYPPVYRTAEISFPKSSNDEAPWWDMGDKCSADYAKTNGIRYFLEDTSHSGTFVFFSIGQYGISAGGNITWQDTIRFID